MATLNKENDMACQNQHRYDSEFNNLPDDQGGKGRHKCAGFAYEKGFRDGLNLEESIQLNLDSLQDSQAGTVRHKSPHAAYALGYFRGVNQHYS